MTVRRIPGRHIPARATGYARGIDPVLAIAVILAAGTAYARRVGTLAASGRPVARTRLALFATGLVLCAAAVAPSVDGLSDRLFWVHMCQHLVLGDLAPLALVAGMDGRIVRPLLALRPVRALRPLAHPFAALPLWAANLYAWHLPPLYDGALAHPAVHALEHGLFAATGALAWTAVIEPLPGPRWFGAGARAAYVLGIRLLGTALGNVFIFSGHAFYAAYRDGPRTWGLSALADQRLAGIVMLTEGGIVTLAAFAWLFWRWASESEAAQLAVDAGARPAAAARAARYGRPPARFPPDA